MILKNHKKDEWIDIHNLRIQEYGSDIHIDCHLTLPSYWNLEKVHETVHEFEEILGEEFPSNVEIFIHADPCLPKSCSICEIKDCKVRKNDFVKRLEWNMSNVLPDAKHTV